MYIIETSSGYKNHLESYKLNREPFNRNEGIRPENSISMVQSVRHVNANASNCYAYTRYREIAHVHGPSREIYENVFSECCSAHCEL